MGENPPNDSLGVVFAGVCDGDPPTTRWWVVGQVSWVVALGREYFTVPHTFHVEWPKPNPNLTQEHATACLDTCSLT